jgi:hypothetical protein
MGARFSGDHDHDHDHDHGDDDDAGGHHSSG